MKLIVFNLFVVLLIGCEKKTAPFSADAINPPQGSVSIYVKDETNPAPDIAIQGIDPSGDTLTTASDSNGMALFDPIPFKPGQWTFKMPNQNYRCLNASAQSMSVTIGTNAGSVTFQDAIPVTLRCNFISAAIVSFGGGGGVQVNADYQLLSPFDCGAVWTVSIFYSNTSNIGNWIINGTTQILPNQTYSFDMVNGQTVNWSSIDTGAYNFKLTLSSSLGQTTISPTIYTAGVTTTF